jgi:hypothetical protein
LANRKDDAVLGRKAEGDVMDQVDHIMAEPNDVSQTGS